MQENFKRERQAEVGRVLDKDVVDRKIREQLCKFCNIPPGIVTSGINLDRGIKKQFPQNRTHLSASIVVK